MRGNGDIARALLPMLGALVLAFAAPANAEDDLTTLRRQLDNRIGVGFQFY